LSETSGKGALVIAYRSRPKMRMMFSENRSVNPARADHARRLRSARSNSHAGRAGASCANVLYGKHLAASVI